MDSCRESRSTGRLRRFRTGLDEVVEALVIAALSCAFEGSDALRARPGLRGLSRTPEREHGESGGCAVHVHASEDT